ncbi:MAG TPA: ABC transporter substrate-binding protein [Candidatus Eisenbacteria bacterium]|nr:ABC transporter substrate-binding protein [Candidatus Eisenbacteria bacterium]
MATFAFFTRDIWQSLSVRRSRGGVFYRLCLLSAVAVLSGLLSACWSSPKSGGNGRYLAVAIESEPTRLDPRYATDANSVRVGGLLYDSLLRPGAGAQWEPELAERWTMPDSLTYRFFLRAGVRFHDGRLLTARDVKYTYDSILDPKSGSPRRAALTALSTVELLGTYEIQFRLSQPYAAFLEHCTIGIVPEGTTTAAGGDSRPPVGSGAFILEAVDPGERLLLRANPDYWEGAPPLPGIEFRIVPDAVVRVLEFKKGTIHMLQNDLEPDMLPWLERHTDAVIDMIEGTTFQYIGINLQHPILARAKVRQALAHAIDRDAIIRHLLKGQVTAATGLLSPDHWAYNGAVPTWPYDPRRAMLLLDEAGYPDPDGPGPKPRFKLSFKTTQIDLRRRIAEAFKEQLAAIGVELEVRAYEWAAFYSDVKNGNFHLFSLAWVGVLDPDVYYNLFHSTSVPPRGDNRGRYSNAALDELLEAGRTVTDPARRKAIYAEVQRIVAQDLPYVPLWWWKNTVVRKPSLVGFTPRPDGDLVSFKRAAYFPGRG